MLTKFDPTQFTVQTKCRISGSRSPDPQRMEVVVTVILASTVVQAWGLIGQHLMAPGDARERNILKHLKSLGKIKGPKDKDEKMEEEGDCRLIHENDFDS